ncbi:MAG TPA: redox-sensing transcriptional repressor Rex [Dehalococcoidia bacterium]|jgi:redox-sensing transcriptional repressor|nr:redox-sensing transcriptional repressor Rex [Dehalococcoidia bacterium]
MAQPIPEVVILRLPLYLRTLSRLAEKNIEVVSSRELGNHLQFTPAQIRKDLSYFGRFGKQGRGYDVKHLLAELKGILGLDRSWPMALIGVGQLGRAILSYRGFATEGFQIVAAFDSDPAKIGKRYGKLTIQDVAELNKTVAEQGIAIAIVAVPPSQAQQVINTLVASGVKAILNYVPITARLPKGVWLRDVDPTLALQTLTYHLKLGDTQA